MGSALQASGRDIIYSCSWPAYLGNDETTKPFASFIAAGCNLWRNFIDMGPTVGCVPKPWSPWSLTQRICTLHVAVAACNVP